MPLFADSLRGAYAGLVVAAIVIAGLVFGQDMFIPLAIAGCLTFIVSPIVGWLESLRLSRALAVVLVMGTLVVGLIGTSVIFAGQIVSLAADLETYRENLASKIRSLTSTASADGRLRKASQAIDALGNEIAREIGKAPAPAPATTIIPKSEVPGEPTRKTNGEQLPPRDPSTQVRPVVVKVDDGRLLNWSSIGSIKHYAAMAGLTLLFSLFMLLQSADLRDRIIRVAGTNNVGGSTAALGDAAEKLSRLFLAQAIVNSLFGVIVGCTLWLLGVPNAMLWGIVAAVMRFVPYIGSFIAAVPPILLALAVDPGWSMAIAVLAVFLIGEPLMGHVVEPLVLGPQAGLSPFAMIMAAAFWGLIWGPVGLVLAAPLTMTLVVLGRYVKGLEFLTVLLGDQPPLSPPQTMYQRLLSEDEFGALEAMQSGHDDNSSSDVIDTMILPALALAADDYDRGQLSREKAASMIGTLKLLGQEMELDHQQAALRSQSQPEIAVVAVRSHIDRAAAAFIGQALRITGSVKVSDDISTTGLTAVSNLAEQSNKAHHMVVLVSAGGRSAQFIPALVKRIERSVPDAVPVILHAVGSERSPIANLPAKTRYCSSMRQLLEQVAGILPPSRSEAA